MANLPVNIKSDVIPQKNVERTKEGPSFSPPVDIFEEKGELVMVIDLPGVSKDDIQLMVDNGIITISGHSKTPEGGDLRYWEFSPCKYYRAFELSTDVDQKKINADYKQGVLTIHMPKQERAIPREITIGVK